MGGWYLTLTEVAEVVGVPLATLVDWQNFPGMGPEWTAVDGHMTVHVADLSTWLGWLARSAAADSVEQGQHEVEIRGVA